MKEEWRDIEGFEGRYQVSNQGAVRNVKTGKILKPLRKPNGYLFVTLSKQGKQTNLYIHRLVAYAFCEKKEGCEVVNHINGKKTKNHFTNLEWVTPKDNSIHAMKQGLKDMEGIHEPRAVVARKESEMIYFPSITSAEKLGFIPSLVCRCCKGELKTYKGYEWEYAEKK